MTGELVMGLETPAALFARLRLGREEFCQRLLTTLLLDAAYPKWNTRSRPGARGVAFLRDLYERCFGEGWPGDDLWLIDEFELAARTDQEKGAYPDYGVVWDERVWVIELKTERGSHRPTQIPYYFELARHHHPEAAIDFTYLTGPGSKSGTATNPWERFTHLEWSDVIDLSEQHWPTPELPGAIEVVTGLVATIRGLDQPAQAWREAAAALYEVPVPAESTIDPIRTSLALAARTAEDGEQRALDVRLGSLDALHELRMHVRDELAATPTGDPLRHVLPWVWRPESKGRPMTEAGKATGFELRFSRYEKVRYV
jgi:hypothetical protein